MENAYIIVLFLFVLFLLLGTGVWVGLALIGVAWVGMELFTSRPVGGRDADNDMVRVVILDTCGTSAVHLDGRDPLSNAIIRRHVPRAGPVDGAPSGWVGAHQYRGLYGVCRRFRVFRRDIDHGRQDVDPGIAQTPVSRKP